MQGCGTRGLCLYCTGAFSSGLQEPSCERMHRDKISRALRLILFLYRNFPVQQVRA